MSGADILVIGAGLGGLAAARDLSAAGQTVTLLDKARGVSGRAATRRVTLSDGREARLDHGARYFTARHGRTHTLAEGGVRDGWNAVWTRGVPHWHAGTVSGAADGHPRYAPPQGMSALGRTLARGLNLETGVTVTSLERRAGLWRVHTREGLAAEASRLVLNLPAPQLVTVLEGVDLRGSGSEGPALEAARVEYAPCWVAGAVLQTDIPGTWPALRADHPVLEWLARELTKRPPGHPPALMLHATPAWSAANLERSPEDVLPELLTAASQIAGPLPEVEAAFAHRWRYAIPTRRAPGACHWDAALGLGWCGDWFTPDDHGPRVEAALLSGWSLARRVLHPQAE
ncbi:NAD(P)-binding protein [Deinococcus taeanensis]|uniref:NAD(P)/FAD-dependent oxidoreductase n=1 Tax=Deinococcus taeanensis TaxID=2737050 RepID=UPI001CDB7704|nr:NAD(P)-binding protein [Deinococcus taeanensis]UBV43277.1 NAD(P)-binding protein [Deinococcus taeanensis]